MSPVHVVGDADTVLAFALGGVPGRVVRTTDEAHAAVDALASAARADGGPAREPVLILVTHTTAHLIRQHLNRVSLDPRGPLILEIPGFGEAPGESLVERFVERVLGVHL